MCRYIIASVVRKSIQTLFEDAAKSKSAMKRLLNPAIEDAGSQVFPTRTAKHDQRYGIHIDKGDPVKDRSNTIRLHLQINSNAENKTLWDLAKKDSHKVVSVADINATQEVTEENLNKVKEEFLKNVKV